MAILSEEVRQKVENGLKGLKEGLKLVVFTQEFECPSCGDNRMLMDELSAISDKVDIEVLDFVGDKEKGEYYKVDKITCPYCPTAVQMAHEMAMESPLITSDMVEATEFPYLNHKYNVAAVPKVVINETIDFEGAVPELDYLKHVMRAGEK